MGKSESYTKQSHYYRGWVISEFATLEKHIENFIMKEMGILQQCGYEMQTIILDRMTFEAKRSSFKSMLEDKFSIAGFVKSKKKSFPFKDLLLELVLLNNIRNQFAHYELNSDYRESLDALNFVLYLNKYRDGYTIVKFTLMEIESIVKRIHKAVNDITKYCGDIKIDENDLPF